MSKAIDYQVPAREQGDPARRELDMLLENLHQVGVLRLANDVLAASPQVTEIVLRGLNQEQTSNAIQNVSLIAMALGRIPPERFAVLTRAVTAGLESMEAAADGQAETDSPGVIGAFRLLHDDDLWRGLSPLLAGLRSFGSRVREVPRKPAAERHNEG